MSAGEARTAMKKDRDMDFCAEHLPNTVVPIQEELRRVDKLYGEAVDYAHTFIDGVREGKPFDFSGAAPLVNGFIDSIFRNEFAAAAISKLKSFDEYTYTHCINVSILAVILGKKLDYSREKLEQVGMAGMFHDVGKAVIPGRILNKPGKLTEAEMNVMRTHPLHGYQILRAQKDIPEAVLRGALEHHEKHDGSGYPRGLKGDEISEVAQLLAVVDVYDALTSKRVYKKPMPPSQVLAMMYKWRVTDFYPNTVEQFIKSLGVYPVGSFIRLSTDYYAVVTDPNPVAPLKPIVRILFDEAMRPVHGKTKDLSKGRVSIKDIVNPDIYGIDIYRLIK